MTTVLNLGGTIALSYEESGPVTLSGPELLGETDLAFIEIDPVQSNALGWTHLLALREELLGMSRRGDREAVVITGTGTVEDVATFLQLVAPADLRIALLVSLQTANRGTRAPGIDAALAWLASNTGDPLRLFVDGHPFSYPFEKRWKADEWEFISASPERFVPSWRLSPSSQLNPVMPAVPVVSVGIGCATWIRDVTELVPSAGLVLEAYGAGDVPPEIFPAIGAYIARGGHVVITSHGRPGRIEPTYPNIPGTSHEMLSAGCYGGGLLTSRQARMRMAVALASGMAGAPRQAFETFPFPDQHGR
jgi:L-asparaginase/Glu-tRNA(Gln) amidotransferase subunit D